MTRCGSGRFRNRHRGGAILVIVMVLLVVVVAVAGSLVTVLIAEHRQLRGHHDRLQALWLAESGAQRAAARLGQSADYAGETWTVPAEALSGDRSGQVEIRVQAVAGQPQFRRVLVTADYPNDLHYRKRHSMQQVVEVTP